MHVSVCVNMYAQCEFSVCVCVCVCEFCKFVWCESTCVYTNMHVCELAQVQYVCCVRNV